MAQSTGTIKYTDCFSAEGQDSPNKCPVALSAGTVEYTDSFSAEG